jgi:hypothetical protein
MFVVSNLVLLLLLPPRTVVLMRARARLRE